MRNRGGAAVGLILVLAGLWFLAIQVVPGVKLWANALLSWPYQIVALGVVLFLVGLVTGSIGLDVAGCVIGGVGGILAYQNLTGDWASWSYLWALIPGFAGVGNAIGGIFHRDWNSFYGGLWSILVSLVLFGIFGSFLGGRKDLAQYWPLGIILMGVILLVRPVFRRR